MNPLWLLIKKNLTLLLRAKASALVVVFAPLLIILVLGVSYNTSSPYNLNIGIVPPASPENSALQEEVQAFMGTLQQEGFKTVTYERNAEEQGVKDCLQDLSLGAVHTCIKVPASFAVEGNTPKEVLFYVDPSRVQLVWMIQETLNKKFDFKAQEISLELSQELLSTLSSSKAAVGEKKSQLQAAKDQTSSASSSISSAQNSLGGLDFAVSETIYDSLILENLSADATSAGENIALAKGTIESTNLSSSEKAKITSDLEDAQNKVKGVAAALKSDGSLSVLVGGMEVDLAAARSKLHSLTETVQNSNSQLGSSSTTLQEAVTAMDAIIQGLGEVQGKLESQRVTDPATLAAPIITKVQKVGQEGTYLNSVFPALLVLVVMFTSLLLGTTLVMMEKNSPAFVRNFFLPLRKITFITATFLTNSIVMIIQLVIILGVSLFFLEDLASHLPVIFLVLLVASTVFTFLGMGIGYLFISEETGVLASISLGSLLLFVSGVILPLESIPSLLRQIMFFNPYVIAEKVLREILIFKTGFSFLLVDLGILLAYSIVLFLVLLVGDAYLQYRYTHRTLHHRQKLLKEQGKQEKNAV